MSFPQLHGKRILVSGGAGFLGRHVVEKLKEHGVKDEQIFIGRSNEYDLRDPKQAKKLLAISKPDIVIGIAARLSGIGDNIARPAQYFLDNIQIGLNLIEASRAAGIEKYIHIGTVCSYPRDIPTPFKEEDLWNGFPEPSNAPYGIAKKAVGAYLVAAYQQYGFNSIQLILTNLYGPYDDFRDQTSHVIPALIKRAAKAVANNQEEYIAWGDGSPTRDFLYVTDAAEGIVRATALYNDLTPVNLASGIEVSIEALLTNILDQLGYKGAVKWDMSRPNGQPNRVLDISKAKNLFSFSPDVTLRQGLANTIDWYRANEKILNTLPPKYADD
jgi:GDP-L-fucose synthase